MANVGKNIKRRVGLLVLTSVALGAVVTGISPSASAEDGSGLAAPIEGTWILKIDRITQGFSFSALQSFTAGGVTVATGTIDRTPAPPISPLYGSWRRVGSNTYAATICFFVFDASGNALAMIKSNETFQLTSHNELVGTGSAFACDINGDNCVSAPLPITITGKRLVAQGA
jgi:hypothetical protein